MYNVFIEYNHKIAEFQIILTILATFAEVIIGVILFTGVVAAIFGEPAEVPAAVEEQEKTSGILIAPQPVNQQQIPASTTIIVNAEPCKLVPVEAKPTTVAELRMKAQTLGVKGAARKNRAELIAVLG